MEEHSLSAVLISAYEALSRELSHLVPGLLTYRTVS